MILFYSLPFLKALKELLLKFLHLADAHFGAPYMGLSEAMQNRLKDHQIQSLKQLAKWYDHYQCQGLIIAGDLFDRPQVPAKLRFEVDQLFSHILDQGGFVVYATGNHDFGVTKDQFAVSKTHEHFVVFNQACVSSAHMTINDQAIVFHGIGYRSPQPKMHLSQAFKHAEKNQITIGLFHGLITQQEASESQVYYSMTLQNMRSLDYDYFALGHVHDQEPLGPSIHYPGHFIQTGFDDAYPGKCLLVTLADQTVEVHELICHGPRLKSDVIALNEKDFDGLMSKVLAYSEIYAPHDHEEVLKLHLKGSCSFPWEKSMQHLVTSTLKAHLPCEVLVSFDLEENLKEVKEATLSPFEDMIQTMLTPSFYASLVDEMASEGLLTHPQKLKGASDLAIHHIKNMITGLLTGGIDEV